MPNRMLRDYTDSLAINELSLGAEVLFIRLIMKADDFGKYHANSKLLKAALFPFKDSINDKQVASWVDECKSAGLIEVYVVNNKEYLKILNFGQRMRIMNSKYPDPEPIKQMSAECQHNDGEMTAQCQQDDGLKRIEVEIEEEIEIEKKGIADKSAVDPWDELVNDFFSYRKQIKKPLKDVSRQHTKDEFIELSGKNIDVARKILKKTMSNGWQGIFKLKDNDTLTPHSQPVMKNGNFGKL